MTGRVQGQVAVITGAGTGIGRACFELFAREGATVVGVGRPVLWGLINGGAPGVKSVYAHLAAELKSAMMLSGVSKVTDIKPPSAPGCRTGATLPESRSG